MPVNPEPAEGFIPPASRGGAVAARRAHNPKVVGSNPTPATKTRYKNEALADTRAFLFGVLLTFC